MKICQECGTQILNNKKFCSRCGAKNDISEGQVVVPPKKPSLPPVVIVPREPPTYSEGEKGRFLERLKKFFSGLSKIKLGKPKKEKKKGKEKKSIMK